jgi:hypothetical protein
MFTPMSILDDGQLLALLYSSVLVFSSSLQLFKTLCSVPLLR